MSLRVLKLSRNRIADPSELIKLGNLASLVNLSISGNPVMASPNVHEYCVFHVRNVEVFNELRVSKETRERAAALFSLVTSSRQDSAERSPLKPKSSVQNECCEASPELLKSESVEKRTQDIENSPVMTQLKSAILSSCLPPSGESSHRPLRKRKQALKEVLRRAADQRKTSHKLQEETEELKEMIKVKNDHLAVLRKQMVEQSVESYMSDTDGFCIHEERASEAEVQGLEKKLREKEARRGEIVRSLEESRVEISRLELEVGKARRKCAFSQTYHRRRLDTPRFSRSGNMLSGTYKPNRTGPVVMGEDLDCASSRPKDETNAKEDNIAPKPKELTESQKRLYLFFTGLLKVACKVLRDAAEHEKWDTELKRSEQEMDVIVTDQGKFNVWTGRCLDMFEGRLVLDAEKRQLESKLAAQTAELEEKTKQERFLRDKVAAMEISDNRTKDAPQRYPSVGAEGQELKTAVARYKAKIEELQTQLDTINETVEKSARRANFHSVSSGGVRSTLKILQALEGEREKCRDEECEQKMKALRGENEELKREMGRNRNTGKGCEKGEESEFAQAVVRRAVKLNNYIAEKFAGEKLDPEPAMGLETWRTLDRFTRQTRAYIRSAEKTERSMSKLKSAKGRFMDYIEKEVTELTRNWNLMESERAKLQGLMRTLSSKADVDDEFASSDLTPAPMATTVMHANANPQDEERLKTQKKKLIEEIARLEGKKLQMLENIEQLIFKEQEMKLNAETQEKAAAKLEGEIGVYGKRVDSLKEAVKLLQSDRDSLQRDVEAFRAEHRQSEGVPMRCIKWDRMTWRG